jgi:hypothetical protein
LLLLNRSSTNWAIHLPLPPFLFFCFSCFSGEVFQFCGHLAWDHDPLTYVSFSAKVTSVHHHAWLVDWDQVSLTFSQDWPSNTILPIFTTQVAGISGMFQCIQPHKTFRLAQTFYHLLKPSLYLVLFFFFWSYWPSILGQKFTFLFFHYHFD